MRTGSGERSGGLGGGVEIPKKYSTPGAKAPRNRGLGGAILDMKTCDIGYQNMRYLVLKNAILGIKTCDIGY